MNMAVKKVARFTALIPAIVLCIAMFPRIAYAGGDGGIVVSLGDSYSSGEGCPPFYGQGFADKYSQEDWLAHRSENSWEGQLVLRDGTKLRDVKASWPETSSLGSSRSRWYFYASSGAVAVNVYSQEIDPKTGDPVHMQIKEVERGIIEHGTPYHIAPFDWSEYETIPTKLDIQIDTALRDLERDHLGGGDVDYVTMSIGGNDIGFSDIVADVALHSGFVDRDYLSNAMDAAWDKYDGRVANAGANAGPALQVGDGARTKRDEIKECYLRIAKEFPNAQVLVVGYPTLLDDDSFEDVLSKSERGGFWNRLFSWAELYDDNREHVVGFASWEGWFVNHNARLFNSELSMLVSEANADLMRESKSGAAARLHFVSVEEAFDGHEAYTKEPYINEVMATQSEDLKLILPISSYSMHPNYLGPTEGDVVSDGISAYRVAVQGKLDELEKERPFSKPNAPDAEETVETPDTARYTVHFTGADLVLPEAWWDIVDPSIGQVAGDDERILWEGSILLGWNPTAWQRLDQLREGGERTDYGDVGTETLADGTTLIFGRGNDGVCSVEVEDPAGRKGYLWTFARSDAMAVALGSDLEVASSCRRMQAEAAGLPDDADPYEIADAFLRACAERLTILGDGATDMAEATAVSGAFFETEDFAVTVPDYWLEGMTVEESDHYENAYQFRYYDEVTLDDGSVQSVGASHTVLVSDSDEVPDAMSIPELVGQSSRGKYVWLVDGAGKRLFGDDEGYSHVVLK